MPDPRILAISLDGDTILPRNPEVARDREVAVRDLLARNSFAPRRPLEKGFEGPYRVTLRVADGRLAIDIADADGLALETIMLGLARFRRPIRDYLAIVERYNAASTHASPARLEPIDMARRGLHNEAAELLMTCLEGKVTVDFDTARRLFTLISMLHVRG